ncbi:MULTISPECIES: chromosome segregation protein SMC [Streptomyces]|uniref:Chromosome partition protein Smc n=1 Tax=Streptomyces stelliscabiei TaxID=146820 RepID=A0A8I0TSW7_9ACTN|nr:MULTISPECIES: chromosome segregation protein SMC [Streptomyces]KND42309.1 chromosome segregation protein SMC [Streptomyces stelliscabiei]MBE1600530.1 chromosome segregation protein [Streptomyces stelliscabiei]MDX2518345.1 chromosome segregation protein SMC [Streptomyces stelliscabiei]MDX2554413.1 chromosome segregation protein SMC [Streptomyces stelliscabiei]MDX2613622.1 chromosome segregation protein SMC [Streptomyces stelliscabiei]
MHLKALTLRGFKSFASATTLRFEPGITCVVGPNGSGKSNVVDALSWVMGEQGAKSLRGGKMEDVIFAGTTGRPPLGRAEVSLTIDNSDGALPIEYAEVTITRIMFRNGGSEYQINGDTCRLLDIQDLLSDSGIGREMHVIVGQGQLDSVLHADPMGRRAFIEEAAGVLKHRKRKEKALRKLDAMQANLARVQDLTDELRRQLKPLGRQAAVARRAAVIQADLRDARLRLLADDLVRLQAALRTEVADEAALKARKEAAETELKKALLRESQLEGEVRRLAPRLQRAQETWYELSQLAERVRGTISLADARVKSATSASPEERRGRDPEDMEREAARVREQEAELEAALEAAERALEDTVEHRAELERELMAEERRLKDVARSIADRRESLARLNGQVNAARSRAASAQAEIDRLAAARDEAQERAVTAQEEYEALQAEVDGLDAGDSELAELHDAAKRALAEAESAVTEAREATTTAERRRAATQARHEALALGLRRKDGTGALLAAKDRLGGLLGPAAGLLTVTPGHEAALAAAFGAAADAIAVTTPASAAEAIRLLRKQDAGRAALLLAGAPEDPEPSRRDAGDRATGLDQVARGPRPLPASPTAHVAADLVRGPSDLMPAVRRLLHRVVVVDTLEDAEELVYARPDLTAVTAEGDLLGAHFAHGGSAGAPSLLEVQASVDEAAAELEELAVRCEELAEVQRSAVESRRERAALVEELGERRRAAEREKSAVAQQLGRLAGQARGAAGEAERSTAAAARAQDALDRAMEEAEELAERLAVAEEMPVEEEPDTSVRDRLAADGANARQTEMEARLQVRTHEERVKGLAGRADSLDRAARAEREARARAEQRRARLRHEAAVAEAVASGGRQLLGHVEVSLARAAEERTAADAAKARREQELARARGEGRDLKAEMDKLTDSVHRGEVLGAEKRMRIEQLETKALEELGVEPEGLVAEYGPDQLVPPSPPAEGEELPEDPEHPRNQPKTFHRAEQEKRLRAAERAYQQLGKVNPLALEEFAALEERHKFLSEQLEDLKKTRADLLQVVKEVDERVEQVFTEAFWDTAREFEGVFSRLFPGGEGRLILTDPDNMLTTGVDVEARPPGKKVKRLSLLSGGERSLTAVAMLVSIFKARPSPFYVMDEVEAALDDTNLQRLIRIMQELQEASQLIVITHQKRTMEVADALYGVSMQGDGVSKVISQRLR